MSFQSQQSKEKHTLKKYSLLLFVSILGTIIVIILMYYIVGYIYYKYTQHRLFKDFTVEKKEIYNTWVTEKIYFPEEALEAKPFSNGIKQAAGDFRKTWKQYKKDALDLKELFAILKKDKIIRIPPPQDKDMKEAFSFLSKDEAFSTTGSIRIKDLFSRFDNSEFILEALANVGRDKELKRILSSLSKDGAFPTTGSIRIKDLFSRIDYFEPLFKAYEKVLWCSDYEIDAFAAGIDPSLDQDFPTPDYIAIQATANLAQLKSMALVESGDFLGAARYAVLNLKASDANPYSSLISRLAALAIMNMGLESLEDIIAECNDQEVLQKISEFPIIISFLVPELIRPHAFFQTDWLGYIRHGKRMGLDVHFQGLTAREIFFEWQRVQALYRERFVLPHINDPEKRKEIIAFRKNLELLIDYLRNNRKPSQNYYYAAEALSYSRIFFETPVPNYIEAKTRENYIRTRLNLLILEIGKKPESPDQKDVTTKTSEPIPDAMKKIIRDLFSKKMEPIKTEPFFYSIGPDGIDQKGEILYDPTNGTKSKGDIFLPFK